MNLEVLKIEDMSKYDIEISDVFQTKFNEPLVHQVITAFLANARQSDSKQKTRAEVSHTTKKPWKQKGTGRARAGMSSSPLWRGGGRIFPNTGKENFTQKINRKMYRGAMVSIISKLIMSNAINIIDAINVIKPKTKEFVQFIKPFKTDKHSVLCIIDNSELTENIYYASRNIPTIVLITADEINPYLLLKYSKIVVTKEAINAIQEQFSC